MKVKILPYVAFFVASLAFAWYASRPTLQSEASGKEWISFSKESIKKIIYTDENGTIEVNRDPTVADAFWIDADEKRKDITANEVSVKDRYLVGDRISELLTELAPFRVEKQIGDADKVNLADFGLDKPTGTFEVQGDGKKLSLLMGKKSFQSSTVFVLDQEKKAVLLVQRKAMSMLEKPKARMAMSKPFTFAEADVSQVFVTVDGKTEKFFRKSQGENKIWYPEAKDTPVEAFRNWIDKVLKLRVEGYPADSEKDAISKLKPKFTLELKGERADFDTWSILEETGTSTRFWLKAGKLPVPVLIDATKVPVLLNDMKAFLH